MVFCSSWNVTKATEYHSLFERVARDRLVAPVRFATDTTCLTLGFPPASHLQPIPHTLFRASGECPIIQMRLQRGKGSGGGRRGISAGLFTSVGVRTDVEDFGGESGMSHLGLHLLKVRLDPPRSTGPVSLCRILTFQPSSMVAGDLTVSPVPRLRSCKQPGVEL